MAKKVDPKFLRDKERQEQVAAAPEAASGVHPVMPQVAGTPTSVSPEPSLPEANSKAESLRGWGRGIMLMFIINGCFAVYGGVLAVQADQTSFAIGAFVAALSLMLTGFWVRDLHYAGADGLDALTEAVRRIRRGR